MPTNATEPTSRTIASLHDLLCGSSPYEFGRALYKYTACGPWISYIVVSKPARSVRHSTGTHRLIPATTRKIYYDSDEARRPIANCIGVDMGSIVEGSDVEVGPIRLLFPFTQADFDRALTHIDAEAAFYWDRDNSTFYSILNRKGQVVCTAQWRAFDDEPIVSNFKLKPVAIKAYGALEAIAPVGSSMPIAGTRYKVRLDPTPDWVF